MCDSDAARHNPSINPLLDTCVAATGHLIPDGYALVKIEPDDAMQVAGANAVRFDTTIFNKLFICKRVFRAMCKASS